LLADEIAGGRFDGKTILIAGFSDGQGDREANQALSLRRAETVAAALETQIAGRIDAQSVEVKVAGYGVVMPLACDDTRLGRALNRRVEIWVSD